MDSDEKSFRLEGMMLEFPTYLSSFSLPFPIIRPPAESGASTMLPFPPLFLR